MRANYEPKKVIDESLPAIAPSAHSGSSKGSLGLYVIKIIIGTSVCHNKHSLTILTQVVVMAQRENLAIRPEGSKFDSG